MARLTKSEARAVKWLDETGTADMPANLFSNDECNERLAMMQRTLAAEFAAVECESMTAALETIETFKPLMAMVKALIRLESATPDDYRTRRRLRKAIEHQLSFIPDPGPVPDGVL